MPETKTYHASDYTESMGLAMAYWQNAAPLEVTHDGINFELLANYPYPDEIIGGDSGCLVILDDERLFLAGGSFYQGTSKAFIYNKSNNTWRAVGDMAQPRSQHSCGLVKSSSGSGYYVAVVGGIRHGYTRIQPIEIFSVDTETWQEGWYTVKHCQRCSS